MNLTDAIDRMEHEGWKLSHGTFSVFARRLDKLTGHSKLLEMCKRLACMERITPGLAMELRAVIADAEKEKP